MNHSAIIGRPSSAIPNRASVTINHAMPIAITTWRAVATRALGWCAVEQKAEQRQGLHGVQTLDRLSGLFC